MCVCLCVHVLYGLQCVLDALLHVCGCDQTGREGQRKREIGWGERERV